MYMGMAYSPIGVNHVFDNGLVMVYGHVCIKNNSKMLPLASQENLIPLKQA